MLNILPPQNKEELSWRVRNRFIQKLFFFLLITFCVFAGLSIISFFLLQKTSEVLPSSLGFQDTKSLEKSIGKFNKKVSLGLESTSRQIFLSKILEELHALTPEGIVLTSLAMDFDKKTIFFEGTALTRENYEILQKRLKQSALFGEFNFPFAITEKENITFSLEGKIHENNSL